MSRHYTLRRGDKGQEVKRLQSKLGIRPDADFGKNTDAAVQAYQNSNGLLVDGVAGPITLSSLDIEVLHGIDVSAWNGKNINWDAVSKANTKYCWIKATEGQTHTNRGHVDKFKGARDHGIIVGGYHFGRPDHNRYDDAETDAKKEAEHFLSTMSQNWASVGIKKGDLLPVLDVEKGMKTDDQYNVEWSLAWLECVEKETGARPVIYTAKWAWDLYLAKANSCDLTTLTSYPVWWASYNEGSTPKRDVRGWKEWNIWQYGSKGSVNGIPGNVDVNWMAGGQLQSLLVP